MATALVLGTQSISLALAQLLAHGGYRVHLVPAAGEVADADALRTQIEHGLQRLERAGRLQESAAAVAARVSLEPSPSKTLPCAKLVFDLLPPVERPAFWQAHGERLAPDTPVAVHSACSPISDTAALIPHPERVLGMYWFAPVELHPLVEITATPDTAPAYMEWAVSRAKDLGKQPVVSQDSHGRVVNRLLGALVLEAGRMLDENLATPADIDKAARLALGANIGPLGWTDQQGLTAIADLLCALRTGEKELPDSLRTRLLAGHTGETARKGFYEY